MTYWSDWSGPIYLPSEGLWGKAFLHVNCTRWSRLGITFDLDLWSTDLKINRDHLHILIKYYQATSTKFEPSRTNRSSVTSCTRWSRLTLPLALNSGLLTWKSIGIILIKDYLPTKFEACEAKHTLVISFKRWSRLTWPLTYWPEYQ